MSDSTPTFLVRPLEPRDHTAWEALWQGYLTYYESAVPAEVTQTTFARLLDPSEPMFALVADEAGDILGLVHFLHHRSTWTIGPYCYLQDLFTAPAARGRGVGRALIEAVHARAVADGASRVYWLTQEGNATARALYDRLATRTGFIQYKQPIA